MPVMPATLSTLPNLGPKSSEWLHAVGIETPEHLQEVGAVSAYKLCQAAGYPTSLTFLWALWGALHNVPWTEIPEDVKQQLRAQL